jgi:hypothetical protein
MGGYTFKNWAMGKTEIGPSAQHAQNRRPSMEDRGMRERAGRALAPASVGALVLLALALALAGCNSPSATVKIPVPTAAPGALQITIDRRQYAPNQPIGVAVKNTSQTDYYALDGQSSCTFLQLQHFDAAKKVWVIVEGCERVSQANALAIPAGLSEPFTLAPGTKASNPNAWDAGVYRIAISYSAQADAGGAALAAYSAGFVVQ